RACAAGAGLAAPPRLPIRPRLPEVGGGRSEPAGACGRLERVSRRRGVAMTAPEQPPSPSPAPERWPRGTRAVVEVPCPPSRPLAPLLARLGCSGLVTAPHSGNLIVVAAPQGRLTLSFHTFERAMGVAVGADALAVCTRSEVWFLRNAPDIAAKL